MPELSRFFGIIIRMFREPDEPHHDPHLHAVYHGIYKVTSFKNVGPRTLSVAFDDGTSQTIDFSPALQGRLYGALKNDRLFKQVSIDPEVHTLVWPNGADFDPETLHDWHCTSWGKGTVASSKTQRVAENRADYAAKKGRGG